MQGKIIAPVDYENTGSLENVSLADYSRLMIFTGPHQEVIRLPAKNLSGEISVSVFRVPCVSKNNVDFHLVLAPGQLSISEPVDTALHIISNDKGYDGVTALLRSGGRACCRLAPSLTESVLMDVISDDEVQRLADKIQATGKRAKSKMPSTLKAFGHYLKPLAGNNWSEQVVNRIKNELVRRKVISVYEKTIVWRG